MTSAASSAMPLSEGAGMLHAVSKSRGSTATDHDDGIGRIRFVGLCESVVGIRDGNIVVALVVVCVFFQAVVLRAGCH